MSEGGRMRVGIVGLLQESNTFIRQPTTWEHFRQDLLLSGRELAEQLQDAHHEVGGFLAGLAGSGAEAIPLFLARALPYGAIRESDFERLVRSMGRRVRQAGPLDGVLAAAHGATVSQSQADADGFWLGQLRRWVGAETPIVCTVDPHANLSPRMIDACQATLAYRTNPHVDQRERGELAARLMCRTLRGEIRPTQVACFPPLAINIERQNTSEEPCRSLFLEAMEINAQPGVLDASICLGFPYADVPEMGAATIVVTDNDAAEASRRAGALAARMWEGREDFVGGLLDVEAAFQMAQTAQGPICLLDMGDNVGGGAPGEGTVLAQAIHRLRLGPSFVCLCDAESAAAARAAGVGRELELRMGGKSDARHGPPLSCRVRVAGLGDGRFSESEPRHGGFRHFDQGDTAVVQTSFGLTIMLTSRRMAPFSLRQLTSCQVNPASFRYLVVKGVQAPLAAYRHVCSTFLRVNTPGVTTADLNQLKYRRRRRPMFPFEPETTWDT